MTDNGKTANTITDFITGNIIPDIGAEANRQAVERFLVNTKGYLKKDIQVDVDIKFVVADESYSSMVDLVICVDNTRFMVIKCAAGSLGSRERETIAAARLLGQYQIPCSVVSDGKTAIVLDTATGKKIGEGLDAIPSKDQAREKLSSFNLVPLPDTRFEKEKLIFRSYDIMNVNVKRKINQEPKDPRKKDA